MTRKGNAPDEAADVAEQLRVKRGEAWWYRQGAYLATGVAAVAIWFVLIGPKIRTPKTEMVEPATAALETGLKTTKDVKAASKDLGFKVVAPDLRQFGGKLTKTSTAEFGGVSAAVMQYQYGKSVFLLYRFQEPSKQFSEMKLTHAGKNDFYLSSAGAVSVIAWKDRRSGYYALAAKATEKDLLNLATKMTAAL